MEITANYSNKVYFPRALSGIAKAPRGAAAGRLWYVSLTTSEQAVLSQEGRSIIIPRTPYNPFPGGGSRNRRRVLACFVAGASEAKLN